MNHLEQLINLTGNIAPIARIDSPGTIASSTNEERKRITVVATITGSGDATIRAQLVIPGELTSLERVHRWAIAQLKPIALAEAELHNVLLAISEAVTNAIRHGSREEATRLVIISIQASQNAIDIEVEDEGDGFDPARLPNPTEGDRLYEQGGRGIFLIRALATELRVAHSRHGTKVTFTFSRVVRKS